MTRFRDKIIFDNFEVVSLIVDKASAKKPNAKLAVDTRQCADGVTRVDIYTLNGDEILKVTMADKGGSIKTTFETTRTK